MHVTGQAPTQTSSGLRRSRTPVLMPRVPRPLRNAACRSCACSLARTACHNPVEERCASAECRRRPCGRPHNSQARATLILECVRERVCVNAYARARTSGALPIIGVLAVLARPITHVGRLLREAQTVSDKGSRLRRSLNLCAIATVRNHRAAHAHERTRVRSPVCWDHVSTDTCPHCGTLRARPA